ncbi:MAG: 50S ribosomal protein L30 [Candidatus Bathyarchaeota archaeon]|nr:50S ribosomal protein L30 [Candidatus Bathyarchaeota archaeon]MDH5532364.1 50S ribosomal protein L30 [Candidatus Bathyarchaeota archaeon]MDH5712504.1 50S ribosomal protein L30 [Candidatus Bathyarchaeota archaeon]
MEKKRKCLAVIRVRGVSDIFRETKETLRMLHLTRNCHATLIDNRPSYLGMLHKAKDYATWGEVSKESVALLLKERGRIAGNKKLTDKYIQEAGYKSLDDLAEAINKTEVEYNSLPNIKPVFRLHPPKKGFKGKIKKSYTAGGVTGYRGEAINDLIKRMT